MQFMRENAERKGKGGILVDGMPYVGLWIIRFSTVERDLDSTARITKSNGSTYEAWMALSVYICTIRNKRRALTYTLPFASSRRVQ